MYYVYWINIWKENSIGSGAIFALPYAYLKNAA